MIRNKLRAPTSDNPCYVKFGVFRINRNALDLQAFSRYFFTTSVPAIMSCSACFFAVKPAIM